jgi:hypothetical protein
LCCVPSISESHAFSSECDDGNFVYIAQVSATVIEKIMKQFDWLSVTDASFAD